MKIERLNENQIRCTLNKEDLEEKDIQLTELAYGGDKAKELFKDMMQEASEKFGFEVDDSPLMIEAIPVNRDCIILVITKVDTPEELDTRYSRFTRPLRGMDSEDSDDIDEDDDDFDEDDGMLLDGFPSEKRDSQSEDDEEEEGPANSMGSGLGGFLGALGGLADELTNALGMGPSKPFSQAKNPFTGSTNTPNSSQSSVPASNPSKDENKEDSKEAKDSNIVKPSFVVFEFEELDDVIRISKIVNEMYYGLNSLYKNEANGNYYLYMNSEGLSAAEYARVVSVIKEYADTIQATYATRDYLSEHYKLIRAMDAIKTFAEL